MTASDFNDLPKGRRMTTNLKDAALRRLIVAATRLLDARDNQMITVVEWRELRKATDYAARRMPRRSQRHAP
jgi:hypothetical protein